MIAEQHSPRSHNEDALHAVVLEGLTDKDEVSLNDAGADTISLLNDADKASIAELYGKYRQSTDESEKARIMADLKARFLIESPLEAAEIFDSMQN